ncbi:MAG: hypothetical protein ACQETO_13935, partial [Pseudomonadota bacterium]
NVIAIWRMTSAAARSVADRRRIDEMTDMVERLASRQHRLKEYATSTHFHHDTMERSLRHHLHAAGLVHTDRVWNSYGALARANWPFDQKNWPYHLPSLDRPAAPDETTAERYARWRQHTAIQAYHQRPHECIDDRHIRIIDESVNHGDTQHDEHA